MARKGKEHRIERGPAIGEIDRSGAFGRHGREQGDGGLRFGQWHLQQARIVLGVRLPPQPGGDARGPVRRGRIAQPQPQHPAVDAGLQLSRRAFGDHPAMVVDTDGTHRPAQSNPITKVRG